MLSDDKSNIAYLKSEKNLMKECDHPNIVGLVRSCVDQTNI